MKKEEKKNIAKFYKGDNLIAETTENAFIGKEENCSICLDDPFVSRKHAVVEFRRDGIFIRDLNSTNGTFLITSKSDRTEPLTPYVMVDSEDKVKKLVRKPEKLKSGDVLLLGTTEILVEIMDLE